VRTPTFSVEVITLPVSDVERARRFYIDQVGFTLDVDYSPNDAFRVVQLTPPGSSCSIQIGNGLTDAPVGSVRSVYLVVSDLQAARSRLLERGVEWKLGDGEHGGALETPGRRVGRMSFSRSYLLETPSLISVSAIDYSSERSSHGHGYLPEGGCRRHRSILS